MGATRVAAQTTAASSAYGAQVALTLQPPLASPVAINAGPISTAAGSGTSAYTDTDSVASLTVSNGATGQILSTSVLAVEAAATVPGTDAASADASVEDLDLDVVANLALSLLSISAESVASTADVTGVCGVSLNASGSTLLTNPSASSLGVGIAVSSSPAPNTIILNALGIVATLNRQVVSGDGVLSRSIAVDAVHVQISNALLSALIGHLTGTIVIAHSEASLTCPPATSTPTSTITQTPTQTGTITHTATHTATATTTHTPTPSATATPTPTATATATGTNTDTPTATATASGTVTDTPTATASATGTDTPTPTATATGTVTDTPTATASATGTDTPTPTATATGTGTDTPTATASATGTDTPTPTATATIASTDTPTATTTATDTPTATATPTGTVADTPTATTTATATPTDTPTATPIDTAPATPTSSPTATALALRCGSAGSGTVRGYGPPNMPIGSLMLCTWQRGAATPDIDDVRGWCGTDAAGLLIGSDDAPCRIDPPLEAGGCIGAVATGHGLVSSPCCAAAPAPLLGGPAQAAALLLLIVAGRLGLARRRRGHPS